MAEDTGERAPEQAPASLFHKLASPIRPGFQERHHIGEEVQVTGVVIRVGVRCILIADVAQSGISPVPEVVEHGGVLAFHRPPPEHSLPALLHGGFGAGDPLLKGKQLGTSGSQLSLH